MIIMTATTYPPSIHDNLYWAFDGENCTLLELHQPMEGQNLGYRSNIDIN